MARQWNVLAALTAAGLPHSLVPVAVAAGVVGCQPETIQRWIRDGVITAWATPWGTSRYLVDLTQILKPVTATGKPTGRRYSATAETRAKMKASQQKRWAEMKAKLAARASVEDTAPPSLPSEETT